MTDLAKYTDRELEEELDRRKAKRAQQKERVRCKDCIYSFFKGIYRCKVDENKRLKSWGVWRICKDFVKKRK